MSEIMPAGDRVLVRPIEPDGATTGGIVIPGGAKEKTQRGTVERVGPDAEGALLGRIVIHGKYAGTEVVVDGEAFILMSEKEILASIL